jgi:hypothetical protein
MNSSENINELATALALVQSQLGHAKKDSKNPFFKSSYADLESVWDACRSLLSSNGLSVMQFPGNYTDGEMSLTTILAHSSGQYIEQTMSFPVSKNDPQGCMACLTYMRRGALAAVVGIVQADDDGNEASEKGKSPSITPQQIASITALIEQTGSDVEKLCAYFKKPSISLFDRMQAMNAISMLEKKLGTENVNQ